MPNEIDPKLIEAIGFFEKMLQTMPDDRTGLEFLAVAYEQTGDVEKQVSSLIKLSEALLKEGDLEHASMIAQKLKSFKGNPQALSAARVADMLVAKGTIGTPRQTGSDTNPLFFESEDSVDPTKPLYSTQQGGVQSWASDAAKAEIEVVWQWKDSGLVPKEVCMDILHVFMDHPISDIPILISALGLLEERYPEYTAATFEAIQKQTDFAPIPLELFEISSEALQSLPLEYMKIKGVIPFAEISDELLVGLMNPMNEGLRKEIEKLAGKVCHFYLIHPAAWFTVAKRLFE